ncbi:hypothetical protein Tco_1327283 [Tanacetum coccineum]
MISGRSLWLCDRIVMTSRPQTRIPSRPRLGVITPTFEPIIISSESSDDSVDHRPLGTDSSKSPELPDDQPSQDPYLYRLLRWSDQGHEFLSDQSYSLVRSYHTHLNGPRKLLTAKKRVRTLPARRLASRHAPHRSSDHHSSASSSSSDPSPVHSLGLDASDQAHSGSSTRDVSPRLCYPSRRAPQCSEAFRHWCAAPLSTLYPPTTSESSSGDSSERPMHLSSHSAGPSRKRCRSPVDSVPLSTPVTRSLAPIRADLLPHRKRFIDSYSSEASIREDAEVEPTETGVDMELGIGDGDDVGDHVEIGLRDVRDDTEEYETDASTGDMAEVVRTQERLHVSRGREIVEPAGEDSSDSSGTRDGIVRSVEDMPIDLDDVVRDFYHHRCLRFVLIGLSGLRLHRDRLRRPYQFDIMETELGWSG